MGHGLEYRRLESIPDWHCSNLIQCVRAGGSYIRLHLFSSSFPPPPLPPPTPPPLLVSMALIIYLVDIHNWLFKFACSGNYQLVDDLMLKILTLCGATYHQTTSCTIVRNHCVELFRRQKLYNVCVLLRSVVLLIPLRCVAVMVLCRGCGCQEVQASVCVCVCVCVEGRSCASQGNVGRERGLKVIDDSSIRSLS